MDPTLSILDSLKDPTKYVRKDNVPVFDEHDEVGPDGKPVHFGLAELQAHADACNKRAKKTGDLVPITDGHTIDGQPESAQPEVLGYAKDFVVGRFGPEKKLGILATFYIKAEKRDRANELPRRSVERWVKEKIFDPIALLLRTPQRDLGLVTYSKNRVRYAMAEKEEEKVKAPKEGLENEDPNPEHEEIVDKFMKRLNEHPVFKYMCAKYAAEAGAPGMPGGGNTFVPEMPKEPEVARMQKEQDAIKYARLENENKALASRVDDLALKYQRKEREHDLVQLQAEGFELDRVEELKASDTMPADAWKAHLARVRKYYRQAPVSNGQFIRLMEDPVEGGGKRETTREQANQAVRMAKEKGISYDAAIAEVKKTAI